MIISYLSAPRLRSRGDGPFCRLNGMTERFWLDGGYFPLLLAVTVGFAAMEQPVSGAAVLLGLAVWFLAFCSDLLAAVCPILLVFVLSTQCYKDLGAFLPCAFLLLPLFAAAVWHFSAWPLQLRAGRSGTGLVLVSLAALLGGCDVMSRREMLSPVSLYYSLGLGVGLLLIYLVFRSEITSRRSYNKRHCFADLFTLLGLAMALLVLLDYVRGWETFTETFGVLKLSYRNFAATVMLTALPMPFYRARQSRRHLLSALVMVLALLLSGSRSALLFGGILLVLCCGYLVYTGAVSRRTMAVLAVLGLILAVSFGPSVIGTLLQSRAAGVEHSNESRIRFLFRALRDFRSHPVFGIGLGNLRNADVFVGVSGSMVFYHNMVAQIMGSMGMLGVVAYGRLICDRLRLLRQGRGSAFTLALGLSYLGMLMISMTNPGEFCPLPNAALMVMVFAEAEEAVGDPAFALEELLQRRGFGRLSRTHS